MPFEFAFLDWLQQFHNPVLDALAVFLNYAGEHGEIWIAFTLLLLLFRRTRKAGLAMAICTTACSMRSSTRFFITGFLREISCRASSPPCSYSSLKR